MKLPEFVTFTGVDDHTDFSKLLKLNERYLFRIEWGVLFSESKQGKDPRYPSEYTIELVQNLVDKHELFLSAHICGKYSRRIMQRDYLQELNLRNFERTQVNTTEPDYERIEAFGNFKGLEPITQHRSLEWPKRTHAIRYLYDCSGGRGESPEAWPIGRPLDFVGYAGGIGPDNVLDVVNTINAEQYWIDMESKIRTDNWLDLDKCEEVLFKLYGE